MSESIKVITEPRVYLVGRQSIDDDALARFLGDEQVSTWETDAEVAGEKLVEVAGRICYWSFARPRPGGNKAYIGHILDVGHGSVLEHEVFNFIIAGVSRSFTHELVRHRAGWAYSQLSQRFVDEGDMTAVVPAALDAEVRAAREYLARFGEPCPHPREVLRYAEDHRDQPGYADLTPEAGAGLRWLALMEQARRDYSYLSDYLADKFRDIDDKTLRRKRAREAARSVLPNATETKIFVTANARALRHFVEMRGDPAADAEIRRVAVAVLQILQVESPNVFADYAVEPLPSGGLAVVGGHRKV